MEEIYKNHNTISLTSIKMNDEMKKYFKLIFWINDLSYK